MKQFFKTLMQIIVYSILVFGLALLTSCSNAKATNKPQERSTTVIWWWRAINLENGTTVRVDMNPMEFASSMTGDSLWINLATHRIDDIDTTTMKCVLTNIWGRIPMSSSNN